jgi:hypothetical protein
MNEDIGTLFLKVGMIPVKSDDWRTVEPQPIKVQGLFSGTLLATDGLQGIIFDGSYRLVHATGPVNFKSKSKLNKPQQTKQSKKQIKISDLVNELIS